jgi:MFS transporter, DHA2 family, multidrug resistance protein
MVAGAVPEGISPDLAAAARDALGGALNAASQIPDAAAAGTLVLTAQHALSTAVQVTSAIAAVISILTAVSVAIYFESASRADAQQSPARPEIRSPMMLDSADSMEGMRAALKETPRVASC